MLPTTFFSAFALSFVVVSAQSPCSKNTVKTCSTFMAPVPNWWPVLTFQMTSTKSTVSLTGTTTVYTTKTIPASPVTSTTTKTTTTGVTTTAVPGTDTQFYTATITTTLTGSTTNTITSTVVSTVITTATTFSAYTTVPKPSGFIMAYDSSGDQTYVALKRALERRRHMHKHARSAGLKEIRSIVDKKRLAKTFDKKKAFSVQDWVNPLAVECINNIQATCTVGAIKTSTITSTAAPSTVTSTSIATVTTTKVVIPGNVITTITVSTLTSTVSTTAIITSTALTTSTTTLTSLTTSLTKSWAACATNNVLGPLIGATAAISHVSFFDSSASVARSSQLTPGDCCAQCQLDPTCQFYQFDGVNQQCWVVGGDANWCPNNQQDYNSPAYFEFDAPNKVSDAFYVGNGQCGTVMDVGQAD